jgi:5-methylcytosine-specific restriction endonuclease McrA
VIDSAKEKPEGVAVIENVSRAGGTRLAAELEQLGGFAFLSYARTIPDEVAWWKTLAPGNYTLELTGLGRSNDPLLGRLDPPLSGALVRQVLSGLAHFENEADAEAAIQRAVHIAPEVIAESVSQDNAIRLKKVLETRGGKVRIREVGIRTAERKRQTIPEAVRNEVWRRDEGRCVDCGSRERLEFDHIIPVSKGGSNTARNLELRCEGCNRRKAARI